MLDTPAGASLQRVGDDRTDVRQVNGRRYNVVERRFLLIPERSGALRLAGARFSGRSAGGFFDDFFGGGDGRMNATGADRTLQVQAQPAQARSRGCHCRACSCAHQCADQCPHR